MSIYCNSEVCLSRDWVIFEWRRCAVISRCCSCKRGRREWGLLVALSTIILSNVIHTSLPPHGAILPFYSTFNLQFCLLNACWCFHFRSWTSNWTHLFTLQAIFSGEFLTTFSFSQQAEAGFPIVIWKICAFGLCNIIPIETSSTLLANNTHQLLKLF